MLLLFQHLITLLFNFLQFFDVEKMAISATVRAKEAHYTPFRAEFRFPQGKKRPYSSENVPFWRYLQKSKKMSKNCMFFGHKSSNFQNWSRILRKIDKTHRNTYLVQISAHLKHLGAFCGHLKILSFSQMPGFFVRKSCLISKFPKNALVNR